jgi:RNA polymerase sigma factor (sigma-70 family)
MDAKATSNRGASEKPDRHVSSWQGVTAEVLVQHCLRHSDGAWAEFLRRYRNLIYSAVRKISLPEGDQEEAFQGSVIAIYQQLARLRKPDRLIPWIVRIARRQALNRLRLRIREGRLAEVTELPWAGVTSSMGTAPGQENDRLQLEMAQQAAEAFESLSERCRRLLHYLFHEDPPPDYKEIARREGIPVGSLGPTRARCLDRIRAYFAARGWL